MAAGLEFEDNGQHLPHPNLRRVATVRRLLKEGRYPAFSGYDFYSQEVSPIVQCFIPEGRNEPAVSFELSRDEAKSIAKIRDELQRQG